MCLRERTAFASGISAGTSPDSFFTKGQDWGFPPLHPRAIRRDGYRYLRDCLAHHLQFAGMLRIDHMMGLHRFCWVPKDGNNAGGMSVIPKGTCMPSIAWNPCTITRSWSVKPGRGAGSVATGDGTA